MRKQPSNQTKHHTPKLTSYRVKGAKKVKLWDTRTLAESIKYYGFSTPEKINTPVLIGDKKPSTLNGANLLTELDYKHSLYTPTPKPVYKPKIHITKPTKKNPFYSVFNKLSHTEINELKTLTIRGGYDTPELSKLYTKPQYSYRYKAHTKTIKPKTINTPPVKYEKGFIPIGSKLLFRCPICNKTKTKYFKGRKLSTPTHTHHILHTLTRTLTRTLTHDTDAQQTLTHALTQARRSTCFRVSLVAR